MTKTSMRLLSLALVCVVILGSAVGTAAAKGKIKGKQIAPNAIATKHLKAAAVTGDKLADGSVTGPKLAAGSVTGPKLASNTVTGAQVNEATLGRVPDAAAIAGATVTPIALKLPNTQAEPITVASGPGWTFAVDCNTTAAGIVFTKTGTASLVTMLQLVTGTSPFLNVFKGGFSVNTEAVAHTIHLVSVSAGTATTTLELTGTFAAGQFTPQTDCFYNGTVTTTP